MYLNAIKQVAKLLACSIRQTDALDRKVGTCCPPIKSSVLFFNVRNPSNSFQAVASSASV